MANREILFRAKRNEGSAYDGQWEHGFLAFNDGLDCIINIPLRDHPEETGSFDSIYCDPETLGQYLCNNQSGKVFDGDILVFPNGSIGVMLIKNGFPYIGSGDIGEYHSIDSILEHEVAETKTAGNIYDNPDLIDPSTIISFKTPYQDTY